MAACRTWCANERTGLSFCRLQRCLQGRKPSLTYGSKGRCSPISHVTATFAACKARHDTTCAHLTCTDERTTTSYLFTFQVMQGYAENLFKINTAPKYRTTYGSGLWISNSAKVLEGTSTSVRLALLMQPFSYDKPTAVKKRV